ncbi:UNVERIFIED_CONTAM: hypothetical protein Sradi_4454200 [Sesamum radiatum]|uniref:Uncharacterized protein n=1 Tax=Sesamum radiatum TaxID=300843 RepID=A0AAW2NRQ3_SESRA
MAFLNRAGRWGARPLPPFSSRHGWGSVPSPLSTRAGAPSWEVGGAAAPRPLSARGTAGARPLPPFQLEEVPRARRWGGVSPPPFQLEARVGGVSPPPFGSRRCPSSGGGGGGAVRGARPGPIKLPASTVSLLFRVEHLKGVALRGVVMRLVQG